MDVLALYRNFDYILSDLLQSCLVLVLLRITSSNVGHLPTGLSLPLRQILVLSIGSRVRTTFLVSDLSYVLPLGKVLCGNSTTDISINLCSKLEVSRVRLNDARWLVDLLTLL